MRQLIQQLETSDVIVYVEQRRLESRTLSGGIQFVAATRTDRILRVILNVNVERDRVIAILAHELQHAIEVAERPQIRDAKAFDRFYRQHGQRTSREATFDTEAATKVQHLVEHQLAQRRCDRYMITGALRLASGRPGEPP